MGGKTNTYHIGVFGKIYICQKALLLLKYQMYFIESTLERICGHDDHAYFQTSINKQTRLDTALPRETNVAVTPVLLLQHPY